MLLTFGLILPGYCFKYVRMLHCTINQRDNIMFSLIKNLFATLPSFSTKEEFVWMDSGLRGYFQAEFKNNARSAFEYFQSTGKLDYGW